MAKIIDMAGMAAAVARLANRAYGVRDRDIAGIDPSNWPSALQPVTPVGPAGSQPLAFPYFTGQNLNFNPRADALYDFDTLRAMAAYPLARILIENTKDQLCQIEWQIRLRKMPGESRTDIKSRRKKDEKGDTNIANLSKFFEYPNREQSWSEWLRPILEDMFVIDAASILALQGRRSGVGELRWVDGASITRYIDDQGYTPEPPSPAFAQIYQGTPRIELTTDQLIYRPRNIVPRKNIASYLYGMSPTEQMADEIKIGMARMAYVLAFYEKGSLGNILHIVPPRIPPDKIREAMNFANSILSGSADQRRMWTMLQGFREDKDDQIIIPDEPVLADVFDEVHIRKLAFAYGAAPQRLQKPMNRGSADASQEAAVEEGMVPLIKWVRGIINYIIQVKLEMSQYEIEFDTEGEADIGRMSKAHETYVKNGIRTRNEIREELGDDPDSNPFADKLTVTLANNVIKLGDQPPTPGGGDPGDGSKQPGKPQGDGKQPQAGKQPDNKPKPAPTNTGKGAAAGLTEVPRT